MAVRLLVVLLVPIAAAGAPPSAAADRARSPEAAGCVRNTAEVSPGETDLADGITYYGFLRQCVDGRPPVLAIDLVQYFQGSEAVREAAADGESLEPDVDPVVYVRNRNPKLRRLGVKLDAEVLKFDCAVAGCPAERVHLDALPWNMLYRFRLQDGLIVRIELPYTP